MPMMKTGGSWQNMRRVTSTSRQIQPMPMMKMGGVGKMRKPPVFKMTGTKAKLVNAE